MRKLTGFVLVAMIAAAGSASAAETRQSSTAPMASSNEQRVALSPTIQLSQGDFERLQAIANRGVEELRRFVWRTRMIYAYRMEDLTGQEPRRA